MVTETWTEANFCRLRMRRNRSIARFRRGNGKCEHRTETMLPEQDYLIADLDPRSCSRSSTFRSESRNLTYTITTGRLISGLVLNHLNKLGVLMAGRSRATCPASSQPSLTKPLILVVGRPARYCRSERNDNAV